MDSKGDLYAASTSGKSAYAIMRTAASVNLGTVSDGVTQSATVYLENTGNAAATLATPVVTEPTNTMFTLVPAATNGCSAGSFGPSRSVLPIRGLLRPAARERPTVPRSAPGAINIATPAFAFNREHERHSHAVVDSAADHYRLQSSGDAAGRPADHAVGNGRRIGQSGRLQHRCGFRMSYLRNHRGQLANGGCGRRS